MDPVPSLQKIWRADEVIEKILWTCNQQNAGQNPTRKQIWSFKPTDCKEKQKQDSQESPGLEETWETSTNYN